MAKVPRGQFTPGRTGAAPWARLGEDMLLVLRANDAGWNTVRDRAVVMPGLDVLQPTAEDGSAETIGSNTTGRITARTGTSSMSMEAFTPVIFPCV